jgi:hypothetical protein
MSKSEAYPKKTLHSKIKLNEFCSKSIS